MSRIAKMPIPVGSGLEVKIEGQDITIKGNKASLTLTIHSDVCVTEVHGQLIIKPLIDSRSAWAMAGTMRALINNMITGVNKGFEKRLQLIGVGYRAQSKGKTLDMALGFSHPIKHKIPEGISIETPSQTEIIVTGGDKQKVGQVAAEIRSYRPPEPYKGKGVRYLDERVVRKEAKKK